MTEIVVRQTAELDGATLAEVRAVMDAAFDGDFGDDDWAHTLGGWHVLALDDGAVVAHAAVVERTIEVGGRPFRAGYVEGVATRPSLQGQGLGTAVMVPVADLVRDRFELGALSTGEHRFYERLGWERWAGPAYVRHGDELVRTPDEDDGVMVLRVGPSAAVDLAAAIACETRPGDDW